MTRLRAPGACVAMLLLVPALCMAAGRPEPGTAPAFDAESAKQAAIYQSRGEDVPRGYVIDRSLLSYTFVLPAEFSRALANLQSADRWLDIGAGEGRAVLDYATSKYDAMLQGRGGKARAVAMSIEDRRTHRWHDTAARLEPDQIRYLAGRRFREYSSAELGQFQVITDVVGAFSYTRYLSAFMEQALGLLQLNGALYTVLQDVRAEQGSNRPFYPDASFLTEIAKSDGSELNVCSWLKSISCAEVSCELKPQFSPPIEVYRVRKVCEAVAVPRLELVHFEAGTPPERRFRLTASAQQ